MISNHPVTVLLTVASRIAAQAQSDAAHMALACQRLCLQAEADLQYLRTTLPPPGTRSGDLLLAMLCLRGRGRELHQAAITRLADQIPWKPTAPAYAALAHTAKHEKREYSSVRRDILISALVLVLAARTEHPEPLRLGRHGSAWVRDEAGNRLAVTGADMAMISRDDFWAWLKVRVCREAEAIARDGVHPDDRHTLDRRVADELADVAMPNPLDLLIEKEQAEEAHASLTRVLDVATPQQRQLLSLIASGATQAAAARQLGLAPSTARVQMKRLRERAQTL